MKLRLLQIFRFLEQLLANQHVELARDVGVELDVGVILTVSADGICKHDLALIQRNAVILFQLLGDILGGDGAVEAAVSARGGVDLDEQGVQLGGEGACLGQLDLQTVLASLVLALDLIEYLVGCLYRQLAGEEEALLGRLLQ